MKQGLSCCLQNGIFVRLLCFAALFLHPKKRGHFFLSLKCVICGWQFLKLWCSGKYVLLECNAGQSQSSCWHFIFIYASRNEKWDYGGILFPSVLKRHRARLPDPTVTVSHRCDFPRVVSSSSQGLTRKSWYANWNSNTSGNISLWR